MLEVGIELRSPGLGGSQAFKSMFNPAPLLCGGRQLLCEQSSVTQEAKANTEWERTEMEPNQSTACCISVSKCSDFPGPQAPVSAMGKLEKCIPQAPLRSDSP